MKACIYLELNDLFGQSGIGTATENHRRALMLNGIQCTAEPSEGVDLCHIETIGPASLHTARKMKKQGKKVIMHAHSIGEDFRNSYRFSNSMYKYLIRYLRYYYNHADLIISPSYYAKTMLENYGVTTEVRAISNGIDVDKFQNIDERRDEARKSYGLDATTAFGVGHVFMRKGIATFTELGRAFPTTPFLWFGRIFNPLTLSNGTSAIVSGAPANVRFMGRVPDIRDAYAAGDVFVFPSLDETQGLVTLEAALAKKPVIIRDLPVYDDVFIDHKNCLKAGSDKEFSACLAELLDDESLRMTLAANALQMVNEHRLENVGRQLKETYEYVMTL